MGRDQNIELTDGGAALRQQVPHASELGSCVSPESLDLDSRHEVIDESPVFSESLSRSSETLPTSANGLPGYHRSGNLSFFLTSLKVYINVYPYQDDHASPWPKRESDITLQRNRQCQKLIFANLPNCR